MLRLTGWGKQGWTYGWDVEEDQGAWGICFQGKFCEDKSAWSLKHRRSLVCWFNCWIKSLACFHIRISYSQKYRRFVLQVRSNQENRLKPYFAELEVNIKVGVEN